MHIGQQFRVFTTEDDDDTTGYARFTYGLYRIGGEAFGQAGGYQECQQGGIDEAAFGSVHGVVPIVVWFP
jgi:hypothetical protein